MSSIHNSPISDSPISDSKVTLSARQQAEQRRSHLEALAGEGDSPTRPVSLQVDKPTVLIVDDDPVARLTLSALLTNDWCRIETVESADEALQLMHCIQPDVILCDLVMKGTNGDQFCHLLKLHGSWRYIPVIAVTRIDNTVAIAAMLEAGADDVVIKPVKARELQARVAASLRTRDRYLELARRVQDRGQRTQLVGAHDKDDDAPAQTY